MKVLVATDGSEKAMKAVHRGLDMALAREGVEVTILSVAPFIQDFFSELPPGVQDKLVADARAALDKAKALFIAKNVKVRAALELGVVPGNNIVEFAQEGKFDRVIIGSSGQHGLLGSTAAKVATYAPCEVVIVV